MVRDASVFRDVVGVGSPAELKELFREWTEDYAARRAEDAARRERPALPGGGRDSSGGPPPRRAPSEIAAARGGMPGRDAGPNRGQEQEREIEP